MKYVHDNVTYVLISLRFMSEVDDQAIELWKLKKQIQRLEATQTNGTSVVSLIAPPTEEISSLY